MKDVEILSVEMFTPVGNNAVLRLPGRRFPGVLVQGDSLSILVEHVREVVERARQGSDEDLLGAAEALQDLLLAAQEKYEKALADHGIALPYVRHPST
jgi:hypothetical protein